MRVLLYVIRKSHPNYDQWVKLKRSQRAKITKYTDKPEWTERSSPLFESKNPKSRRVKLSNVLVSALGKKKLQKI